MGIVRLGNNEKCKPRWQLSNATIVLELYAQGTGTVKPIVPLLGRPFLRSSLHEAQCRINMVRMASAVRRHPGTVASRYGGFQACTGKAFRKDGGAMSQDFRTCSAPQDQHRYLEIHAKHVQRSRADETRRNDLHGSRAERGFPSQTAI